MKWAIAVKPDGERLAVERNDDGTFTRWGYSVWGAVGQTGDLLPEISVVEPKRKGDARLIEAAERMIESCRQSQRALAIGMGIKGI